MALLVGIGAAATVLAALGTGPVALLVLPAAAVVLAAVRLAQRPAGPAIHDRQLDLIVGAGAAAAAVVLVALGLTGAAHDPARIAPAAAAVAVLAAGVGTRRLWHARAVPGLLLLAWPAPWALAAGPADALSRVAGGAVAAGTVAGLVAGVALAVALRTGALARLGAVAVGPVVGALVAAVPLAGRAGPVLALAALAAVAAVVLRRTTGHRGASVSVQLLAPALDLPRPRAAAWSGSTPATALAA
jgi:hypothetical protein